MSKAYIFFNPLAGSGKCINDAQKLKSLITHQLEFHDITQAPNIEKIFHSLQNDDYVIICGGDGTLNYFINNIKHIEIKNDILYYPCGTGNDFALDIGQNKIDKPFSIKNHLKDLPKVLVKGKTYRFINGVGFGIDGYCCEESDRIRQTTSKKVNYILIALKGFLFKYKPTQASITVDGNRKTYKKVWLAPTMYGRFYGGGAMPTPNQKRGSKKLSLMVFHDTGKLWTLFKFPTILTGTHIKYKKQIDIFEGQKITVEFSRPTPLQIDGEMILDVTSYTASI